MQNDQGCYGVPGKSTPRSEIQVLGGNGHGSTNTKIRRFVRTGVSRGLDVIYKDDAVLGGSFNIMTTGVYTISYNDRSTSSNVYFGVSVNTSAPTTSISTPLTYAQGFRSCVTNPAANLTGACAWTGNLFAGDVVRAHTDGSINTGDDERVSWCITRVA